VAIVPDDKDWTWVLERPCSECGFDASTVRADAVAELVRANARAWARLLVAAPAGELRRRPRDDRWSPLEYACHVRDVCALYRYRLGLMLDEDDPLFPNWDQDLTAIEEEYGAQDPAVVATQLGDEAGRLADSFGAVRGEQWQRPGRRSDGATFTVDTFSRYMVHDPIHHLYDVTGERASPS
jgi:DinB superfamily